MNPVTVMVYPFVTLADGSTEHAGKRTPEGWCVWLREETPDDDQQPFDSVDAWEATFQCVDAATLYADTLAPRFTAEVEIY